MRLVETVRIGGRLALAIGFLSMNLVYSNSLSYFYGYSSAAFGVQQSSDPFGNQNVSFTPAVSMVSSTNQTYDYGSTTSASSGYSVLASTYGYSTPATAQTTTYNYSSSTTTAFGTWGDVTNTAASTAVTFSSWNPAAGTGIPVSNSYSTNYASSTPSYSGFSYSGFSTWNSNTPAPSVYDIVYSDYSTPSFTTGGGWQAVNMSVTPRVSSVITTPTVVPVAGTTPVTPVVNLTPGPVITVGAPEPGTLLTLSAGLALVFFKLRKR